MVCGVLRRLRGYFDITSSSRSDVGVGMIPILYPHPSKDAHVAALLALSGALNVPEVCLVPCDMARTIFKQWIS